MINKIIIVVILCVMTTISLQAQEWQTDLEAAQQLSLEQDRNIVIVFQGSDWCAPCMKLEREIWNTETFQTFANDNLIMVKADFPKRKKNRLDKVQQEKNNALAEKYNTEGIFPLVVVLDKNKKILGKTGYEKVSPEEYIKKLTSFK